MTAPGRVLGQQNLSGLDSAAVSPTRLDLDGSIEVDHILATGRVVEIELVIAADFAKDDARRGMQTGHQTEWSEIFEGDVDVLEVRFTVIASEQPDHMHSARRPAPSVRRGSAPRKHVCIDPSGRGEDHPRW